MQKTLLCGVLVVGFVGMMPGAISASSSWGRQMREEMLARREAEAKGLAELLERESGRLVAITRDHNEIFRALEEWGELGIASEGAMLEKLYGRFQEVTSKLKKVASDIEGMWGNLYEAGVRELIKKSREMLDAISRTINSISSEIPYEAIRKEKARAKSQEEERRWNRGW